MTIYNSRALNPDMGPHELQRKVQFDVRYYLCRRGSENIYQMKKNTFSLAYNKDTGMSYVYKQKDEMQKNHKECNNPIITGFMPQLLDTTGRPHHLCPIRSFENYIGRLNERCDFLWQAPNPAAFQRGDAIWFKNSRVGENKLANFMQDLSTTMKFEKKYTNHCIRVTGCTNLTRADFSANQIMSITGHKSMNSLAMYQRVKADEKMMMGMSLAYNLMRPIEVQHHVNQPEIAAPPPAKRPAVFQNQEALPQLAVSDVDKQLQPYDPQQEKADFDLLDFMSEAEDNEIMMAATQMERMYEEQTAMTTKTTTTTLMKRSPKKTNPLQGTTFAGCKIGAIHIHIHKN